MGLKGSGSNRLTQVYDVGLVVGSHIVAVTWDRQISMGCGQRPVTSGIECIQSVSALEQDIDLHH